MKEALTLKQALVLDCINNFINKYGYSPSIRELCEETRLSSTATIYVHLLKLKSKGYINFDEKKSRTIRIIKG